MIWNTALLMHAIFSILIVYFSVKTLSFIRTYLKWLQFTKYENIGLGILGPFHPFLGSMHLVSTIFQMILTHIIIILHVKY